MCETDVFDYRLRHPFSGVVSGPSNSGKTFFVKTLMYNSDRMCSVKFDNFVYIYTSWQPLYDELLHTFDIKFIENIPKKLDDESLFPRDKRSLLILDDVMSQAACNSEVERVFTQYTHHNGISCLLLVQNLFFQGKSTRTIGLNTNYLIIFKNPRDKQQIGVLGRQMFPGNTKFFIEAYQDATERPYSYLLIDYKPQTPERFRLRTDLLSDYPAVYVQKGGLT
jgi:hypothetical protein